MIPYGRQDITQHDIDSVIKVLRSDFLTQGPILPEFEKAIASKFGAKYSCAVNSATSALHVACLSVGLGPGDILWTVPNSFVASANCALYCGAEIDFVDIDLDSRNISLSQLHSKLILAERQGKLPKIIIPVHFAGQPVAQKEIWELSQKYGFKIIEDASHAIGALNDGEPVGSCRWSDITIFSFHPVKIITTAEGGMALTNNPIYFEKMCRLRSHGITRDPSLMFRDFEGAWCYDQIDLGYNYRMNELQAALGMSQIARVDEYVERRRGLALQYNSQFEGLPISLPKIFKGSHSAFHLYVIHLQPEKTSHRRNEVFEGLQKSNIGVNVHYTPIHLQPFYRRLGFSPGDYPAAEFHGNNAITLPLFPLMTDEQQSDVVIQVKKALI
jgi:UDP-4-amino-4,6-dideoxy-N-acetyl-beta-L-altrosamine transaminase